MCVSPVSVLRTLIRGKLARNCLPNVSELDMARHFPFECFVCFYFYYISLGRAIQVFLGYRDFISQKNIDEFGVEVNKPNEVEIVP